MSRRFGVSHAAAAGLLLFAAGNAASAAQFASNFASYESGMITGSGGSTNPASALGSPSPISGDNPPSFPSVLTPFSPPFDADEIVGIGLGGHITLDFGSPINVLASGPEFGVATYAGLEDAAFPAGTNTNPARNFSSVPRVADVEVSLTGAAGSFVSVGRVTFDIPHNYFANAAGPYEETPPANPQPADWGKPFTGSLATFDGLTFAQTLAALDGSGGGEWIDFDAAATGLNQFRFVRFSIPTIGIAGSDNKVIFDAIFANNAAVVPEPAMLCAIGSIFLISRRHR